MENLSLTGVAHQQYAATSTPPIVDEDGFVADPAMLLLRRFILSCRKAVSANEIRRRAMLREAINEQVKVALAAAAPAISDLMLASLDEPDDFPELEAEPPEHLPLDLPGPETE